MLEIKRYFNQDKEISRLVAFNMFLPSELYMPYQFLNQDGMISFVINVIRAKDVDGLSCRLTYI